MKKKIAIIGAGISGLVFGNLLRKNSKYQYVIYEKNNFLNLEENYGLQLAANSVSILNTINFQDFRIDEKYNPEKIDFYALNNNYKICDLDITQFNYEDVNYTSLKRSSLIRFLSKKFLSNEIQFNKVIKKINCSESKIEILFQDNSFDIVDYLVISDGIFSPTKSILFKKNIKANYTGSLAIRGILKKENFNFFNKKNISILFGPNFHLVTYPINKKNEFNLIFIIKKNLSEEVLSNYNYFKDKSNVEKIINDLKFKINKSVKNLLNNAENLRSFPIFSSDKIREPNQKNIFMLGDALFASPPTFAQGASQSIESAYELFKILDESNADIFKKYYINRIKRIKMVNQRSKLNYFMFHLSNPVLVLLRNTVLKVLVGNKIFLNKYLGGIYIKK